MIIKNFSFRKKIKVYFDIAKDTKIILYDFFGNNVLLLKIECQYDYIFSFALNEYGTKTFNAKLFETDFLHTFGDDERNREASETLSNIVKNYYPLKKLIPNIGL